MDKKNEMIELTLDQMDKVTGGTGLSDLSQHMIDNVSEKRKLQDALLVLNLIKAPMELVFLVKDKLKKYK